VGKDTLRGSLFIPDGKGPFPGVIFFHGSGFSTGDTYFEAAERLEVMEFGLMLTQGLRNLAMVIARTGWRVGRCKK